MPSTLEITDTLREVTETLAGLDRPPCSPGERAAAEWLAERLGGAGVESVNIEDEPSWGAFPPLTTAIGALGLLGAACALSGRRAIGAAAAVASIAALV